MSEALSDRQRDILRFIAWQNAVGAVPPSYEEIGARIGVPSPADVRRIVLQLVERDLLTREPGKARSLSLTDAGRAASAPVDPTPAGDSK